MGMLCAASRIWILACLTPWVITAPRTCRRISRRPSPSSLASSSRTEARLARAFGSSSSSPESTAPLTGKGLQQKIALVGTYDTSKERGGSDKLTNGHRFDTIGLCNGFINAGMSCQPVYYTPGNHDVFFETLKQFD